MTTEEFISKLKTALNTSADMAISAETPLAEIPEYDSLGIACVIAMFSDEFGINLDFSEMEKFKTVNDLIAKAGI